MAIDRVPALKRARNLGIEPGVVGLNKNSKRSVRRNRTKPSEYSLQLKEKQKAKFIYGVLEKQFRNLYEKAKRMPGPAGDNLMILLERRIDSVVFRLGLAKTRREARQVVRHGHILVNGKRLNIPSAIVSVGDEISVRDKSKQNAFFKNLAETNVLTAPQWITADKTKLTGVIDRLPEMADLADIPVDSQQIVELYSR